MSNAKLRAFTGIGGNGLIAHSYLETFLPVMVTVGIATVTDLRSRRVPNLLVGISFLAGMSFQLWAHGWAGLGTGAAGAGVALLLFGALFLLGGMGAGDVKLMAAVGSWLGFQQTLVALAMTSILGGIMALAWAIAGGFLGRLLADTAGLILRRSSNQDQTLANPRRRRMPYVPAIALGTLISFLSH